MSNSRHINRDYAKNSTVTKGFRKLLLELYPGLNKDISYRKFIAVLLFSEHLDKDTKEVIIPSSVIANIEEMESGFLNNNYNAESFLKRFQNEVMTPETFKWSGWKKDDKKARTAHIIWKPEIESALKQEIPIKKNRSIKKVLLSTGESYSATKKRVEYTEKRNESLNIIQEVEPAAKELLAYLDKRSFRIYTTKFYENIDETVFELQNEQDTARRDYNLRVLKGIERITKPIYSPSKEAKTDRIFAGSWMLLSRKYRQLLTRGWISYDLKYSQVAIVSALWKINKIQTFLASGGNIWKELFCHLDIDYNLKQTNRNLYDEIKDQLKPVLYGLIFGKRISDIQRDIGNSHILKQHCVKSPETIIDNDIIKQLYLARKKRKKLIQKTKSITTCFGRKLELEYKTPRRSNINSLMAIEAQALEMKLLLPVIKLAKTTGDFQVTLWAHDGFYVWYKDDAKEKTWESRIIRAAAECTKMYNVVTELERQD